MLQPRDPQPLHTRPVDGALPGGKLFDGQVIALAGFVDGQQSAVDGSNHFGLAPDHLASGVCRRQGLQSERFPERPDDRGGPKSLIFNHHACRSPSRKRWRRLLCQQCVIVDNGREKVNIP